MKFNPSDFWGINREQKFQKARRAIVSALEGYISQEVGFDNWIAKPLGERCNIIEDIVGDLSYQYHLTEDEIQQIIKEEHRKEGKL